jgi:hypothetical protein
MTSPPRPTLAPRLDQRALNRALLDRQLLLRRRRSSASATIERLVGMQAQSPNAPYLGLWSRLVDFRTEALVRLLTGRRVVRTVLMRSTVHLVTADDCLKLRPLVRPALERDLYGNRKPTRDLDRDEVIAAIQEVLADGPLTRPEIEAVLGPRFAGHDPEQVSYAARCLATLIQVPPRGIWGRGGAVRYATAESWLGRPLDPEPSIDDVVVRYLAAFGPASTMDVQMWIGLTKLQEVLDRLRPRLRTFRHPSGRELFDLPRAPRPDPETPAPPRFLPEFDNLLLSHADRSHVIDLEHKQIYATSNGLKPTLLVDGFVAATWKIETQRSRSTLTIQPVAKITRSNRSTIATEGEALVPFMVDDATDVDIRFLAPR